jgi:polyisoprenoid-binding protein YceI
MKKLVVIALLAVGSIAAQAQTKWNLDNAHSSLVFKISHLTISETEGSFKSYQGTVSSTKEDFDGANIEFSFDPKTVNTNDSKRDEDLQTEEYFNTAKFDKITFKSTSFKKVSGKNYKLNGNLTIKGVTKPVSLDVVFNGIVNDPWGNTKAGFKFTGNTNRVGFGVGKPGGTIIGEDLAISGSIELAKAK